MSTKFNRNDANVADDQFYASDYQEDLNGVEEDQRAALTDLHAMPCIISGLALTVYAGDDSLFDISAGAGYDEDGYRVSLGSNQLANSGADTTDGAINYICVRHKYSTSDTRDAYKTGVVYYTRKYDDFEIVVRTEAQGLQAGDICVGTSTGQSGTSISVSTDNRTQPDFSGAADTTSPAKVTGVGITTGAEPNLIYDGSGKQIASELVADDLPSRAWIKVQWDSVTDPSGIRQYEVEMVPLDSSDNELPEYLESAVVSYDYV
jgi:hypothetical protein